MPVSLKMPDHEYPIERDWQKEFETFFTLGKGTLDVKVWGYEIRLATLESWEKREISRRHANLDLITRNRLAGVDYLTASIIKIVYGEGRFQEFLLQSDKVWLRSILLKADDKIIQELYDAYLYLERREQERFIKEFGRLQDQLKKGFFGYAGSSLEPLASETQKTQNSEK